MNHLILTCLCGKCDPKIDNLIKEVKEYLKQNGIE